MTPQSPRSTMPALLKSAGVFSDWLHSLASSVWVGGLVCFAFLLPVHWRALGPVIGTLWVSALPARFSAAALVATPNIARTGLYNAALQVLSPGALTGALYGGSPLVKGALFGVIVLFGAAGFLLLSPRLRAAMSLPASSGRLVSQFRVTLAVESSSDLRSYCLLRC